MITWLVTGRYVRLVAPAGLLTPGTPLVVFGRGTDNALWYKEARYSGQQSRIATTWHSLGGILA
jgi:hypothetical protein